MTPAELVAIRESLGVSQRKLAQLLGISQPAVNRWEKGNRAVPILLERALRDLARERSSTTPAAEETAR